jgi:riboflavin kinase
MARRLNVLSELEKIIHLNDLSFIRLCYEKYGVNKGVYNTIDAWFYSKGVENILERRRKILLFLQYIKNHSCSKFGHGGLTIKLQEFFFETGFTQKKASSL